MKLLWSLCDDGTLTWFSSSSLACILPLAKQMGLHALMQADTHIHCMHTLNCPPVVKHNTLIFRTVQTEWLLHGKWCGGRTLCSDKKCDVLWDWIIITGRVDGSQQQEPEESAAPWWQPAIWLSGFKSQCPPTTLHPLTQQPVCIYTKLNTEREHNGCLIAHP